MKRTNPLWGSISILIGVVIAILSLLKGTWATVALIITFALWGLWLVWTRLLPAWSANRAYRRRERQRKWQHSYPAGRRRSGNHQGRLSQLP